MEYFDYADWLADGRRSAYSKGSPDLDTERLELQVHDDRVLVVYNVQLKTVHFEELVANMPLKGFSNRFFNMLALEE